MTGTSGRGHTSSTLKPKPVLPSAGRPDEAATDSGVQLSGHDYFLQPKSALVLEAVPHEQGPAPPAAGQPAEAPPPAEP